MAASSKNVGGRPPKYTDPEAMQEKVDAYFEECKGHVLTDPNSGEVIRDKWGYPVTIDSRVPTITGLALALGFESRTSLLNYQGRPQFRRVVTLAKSRVEAYVEERLFDKDGSNGARFSLQNNFRNWDADKPKADESTAPVVNIICDIPRAQDAPTVSGESGGAENATHGAEVV